MLFYLALASRSKRSLPQRFQTTKTSSKVPSSRFQSTRPRPCRSSMRCFNPRAPCRARHVEEMGAAVDMVFQSTRPMRGATRPTAPRQSPRRVSIHAPHAGRDWAEVGDIVGFGKFQSTRPMRGATAGRSPLATPRCGVSIHAPHAGRDAGGAAGCPGRPWFQSTRPVRGATVPRYQHSGFSPVSIHAPRAGRDLAVAAAGRVAAVSIHAPRAGRDAIFWMAPIRGSEFQSTRPVRGATGPPGRAPRPPSRGFNPRAPCGARRWRRTGCLPCSCRFNPRAPCGARRDYLRYRLHESRVSIHAPRAGRDPWDGRAP